jgi:hypothetical protein
MKRKMPDPFVAGLFATFDRPTLAKRAMQQFYEQDYENLGMLTETGPQSHGRKMDLLFARACDSRGVEYCVVWDDDDLYAKNRISKLVRPMIENPFIMAVGTSLIYYRDERIGKAWLYDNATQPKSMFWIGAPAFRRSAYDAYGPWEDLKCGADLHFIRKIPRERIIDLRDPTLMICSIHDNNAAGKVPHPPAWTEVAIEELPKL